MKDMSLVFFNINGYSLKSLRSINYDEPENQFEQSESDIYGEFENNYTPSKKLVFTIVVPVGEIDELTLDGIKAARIESVGTYIDRRGGNVNTIAFNKAVIQKKTKNVDRSTDTAEYTILAGRVTEGTIKA